MRWSIEELVEGIKVASGHDMGWRWKFRHCFQSFGRSVGVSFKWIFAGYCWSSVWALDEYFITVIIQRLKMFKKLKKTGYPTDLKDDEEWNIIIDHLISGFTIMQSNSIFQEVEDTIDFTQHNISAEDEKRIRKAQNKQIASNKETLQLFVKYFRDLWD